VRRARHEHRKVDVYADAFWPDKATSVSNRPMTCVSPAPLVVGAMRRKDQQGGADNIAPRAVRGSARGRAYAMPHVALRYAFPNLACCIRPAPSTTLRASACRR
jgi:hypothetical protein